MNVKLLVNVCQPATGLSYDTYIPMNIRMDFVVDALSELFARLSEGEFIGGRNTMLWNERQQSFLDMGKTAAENEISGGDRLLLV